MSFVGEHERTIDAKNRLSIPSEYRTIEGKPIQPCVFYLVPGSRSGTLSLYKQENFERRDEDISSDLLSSEDELTFTQIFYSQATHLEVDKQGRVLLPERILKRYKIGREVYLTGAKDHLDLWNKEDFEAFREESMRRLEEIKRRAREAKARRLRQG